MKKLFLTTAILSLIFCGACTTQEVIHEIDTKNPITQTGNMYQKAKSVSDEAVNMRKYAEEMQRRELDQLQLDETSGGVENNINSEFGEN